METSRRDFLKVATLGGAAVTVFGFDLRPAYAQLRELKIARATETRSTCPYCAVGCGVLIYTIGDRAKNVTPQVIHVEGDPDHPTNRGTLCPKGSSLEQDMLNPRRLTKPQVRRPGGTEWEDISWDKALDEIARWTKKTRDATVEPELGMPIDTVLLSIAEIPHHCIFASHNRGKIHAHAACIDAPFLAHAGVVRHLG